MNKLSFPVFGLIISLACGGGGSSTSTPASTPAAVPTIVSFTADTSSIHAGEHATLTWNVSGATTLSIDHSIGTVTGNSVVVTPAETTTYTLTATNSNGSKTAQITIGIAPVSTVRIAYLHHSTGESIWSGGVSDFFVAYNAAHSTQYQITSITYPNTGGGYPWANYPYDYWNLWVNHTGTQQDHGELNLDLIAAQYDVIVFKHCFPVSSIGPDSDCNPPNISSQTKTIANYQLQYNALKARMLQFPTKKFILWTGAALRKSDTTLVQAQRAKQFFDWVKSTWDVKGDNIFIWDFWSLETTGSDDGGIYLNNAYSAGDSHPNGSFSSTVAPYIGQRIVDIIEGKGDTGSITGH